MTRRSLALAALASVLAVSDLGCVPETTVRTPHEPVEVASNVATVVLVYPPVEAEGAPAMPLFQRDGRGVWFRFTLGDARPIADLDAGTYSVVRLPPGAHTIVAAPWACTVDDCPVAVLDAHVAPDKLYVLRLTFKPEMVLERVAGPALVPKLSGYQRLTLDPSRAPHWILDSESRRRLVDQEVAGVRGRGLTTLLAD